MNDNTPNWKEVIKGLLILALVGLVAIDKGFFSCFWLWPLFFGVLVNDPIGKVNKTRTTPYITPPISTILGRSSAKARP